MRVEAASGEPKASKRIFGGRSFWVDGSVGHAEMYFGNQLSERNDDVSLVYAPTGQAIPGIEGFPSRHAHAAHLADHLGFRAESLKAREGGWARWCAARGDVDGIERMHDELNVYCRRLG